MTVGQSARILVVGAGPVGLTVAHELARRGIDVRLIDAADGPRTTSRALANHARTLEIYDQMGVLDDLLAAGRTVEHFTLHQGGRRLIRFDTDYSRLPTRFPFTLMVDQAITEQTLRRAVEALSVPVEWGTRLEDLTGEPDGVAVELTRADGTKERVRYDWLVGCDGGRSAVRKRLQVPLIGDSTERWLIADAVVDTSLPGDSIHWIRVGNGTVMLVPFPESGKWRLLDTADTELGGPAEIAAHFARKISAGIGEPVKVRSPTWTSVFTIQQRMIPTMRSGRCFLAGDAGHVHSPASGQGMNTGIQDGYNLAWKLAAVATGRAGETLLDSYDAERVPIGRKLLKSTRTATWLVALSNAAASAVMPVGLAVLRNLRPVKRRIERKIMRGMSALDLRYDPSAGGPAPRPGTRVSRVDASGAATPGWAALLAELRDPRWTLLVFTREWAAVPGRLFANDEDVLSVRVAGPGTGLPPGAGLPDPDGRLAADLGVTGEGWLLIRPDGYLADRGAGLDRMADAVRSAVGVRRPAPAF